MYNDIHIALDALMQRKNQTYGIDHFIKLLKSMGNPQDQLQTIHIGGTNGKGSTTNYTRSILQEAGFRVGTFTSPHLIVHNDRIRINNVPIADDIFLNYINQTYPLWDEHHLSMFEIDMLISILYFLDEGVDYVIYEVGLGGRLDATNVINPEICAITNIGLDHQGILGDTITAIAHEKAGIIKEGVQLVTTIQDREALDVMINTVHDHHGKLKQLCIPRYKRVDKSYFFEHENVAYTLTNQGSYQVGNAALAASIVRFIIPELAADVFQRGVRLASWAGRFEEILPNVYVDGAHNEMGIERLVQSAEILPRPHVAVFAALKDKEYENMVHQLTEAFDTVIVTEFDFFRAARAQELAENQNVQTMTPYTQAIDTALENQGTGSIIVTGSLYFISEAREYLIKKVNE